MADDQTKPPESEDHAKRAERFETRRAQYFAEHSAIASRENAAMLSMNSEGSTFSAMILRTIMQFDAAAILGVPAVVLASGNAPTGYALAAFVAGVGLLFASMASAMFSALTAYASFIRGASLFETQADMHRNGATLLLNDGTPEGFDDAHEALAKVYKRKQLSILIAIVPAFITGWLAFLLMGAGVVAIGGALVKSAPVLDFFGPLGAALGLAT